MKKNIPLLIMLTFFATLTLRSLSQDYSIRTNLLNLIAKGPSVTLGKNLKKHSEILLTYSRGSFAPFFTEDSYKFTTVHAEYRKKDFNYSKWMFYYGGYLRYINKRIVSVGYEAGPYGIFSKQPRDFTGNGISTGLTSGFEWSINKKWLMDFNTLLGGGKYISEVDYAGHSKILFFLDTRIAVQLGYRF